MKITLAIALSTLVILTGCTSTSEPSPEMKKITNQQIEIEALKTQQVELQKQLATWQEIQPNVARLVVIEDDLNILIQQLRNLTKKNEMKTRENEDKNKHEEKNEEKEARPFFMLQLTALHDLDKLKTTWVSLQALHPEILNGLPARYQQVEVKGKQYYRLKAGEFKQKSEAVKVCNTLIAQQASCIVVNNTGEKL